MSDIKGWLIGFPPTADWMFAKEYTLRWGNIPNISAREVSTKRTLIYRRLQAIRPVLKMATMARETGLPLKVVKDFVNTEPYLGMTHNVRHTLLMEMWLDVFEPHLLPNLDKILAQRKHAREKAVGYREKQKADEATRQRERGWS